MGNDVNIKVKLQTAAAEAKMARFTAQIQKATESTKQASLKTQIYEQRLKNAAKAGESAGKGLNVFNISLASFIGNITSRAVSSGVTALVNGFKAVVDNGREFEEAIIQISKTTGLSVKETEKLARSIQDLGQEVPIATENLLDIAKVAGQLGIQSTEDIAAFTETIGKLQLATDIAGEEGSQSVARILNITGELEQNGSENINKFGSVITQLGNNFAATESQILSVANEVAKGTAVFGVSSEDVLGLATAFKVTGSEAEISGTAIQKVFREIGKAVEEGGTSLKVFAESAGISEQAFATLFRQDPTAAFVKLAEGLGKSGLEGAQLTNRLERLGLSSERVTKTLAPLITRYDELGRAISTARQEAEERNALDEETRKAQESLNADLTKLSNSFQRLSTVIFNEASPAMREMVQSTTNFLNLLSDVTDVDKFNEKIKKLGSEATFATGFIGSLEGGLFGIANQLAEADNVAQQNNEIGENYVTILGDLGQSTQNFVEKNANLNKSLEETRDNYIEVADAAERTAASTKEESEKSSLFNKEKLESLQKFFSDKEQLELQSKFNTLKTIEEIEAFERFVAQEGQKRQRDAFAATIGLDKATLEVKRKKEAELKRLAEEERKRMEEMRGWEQEYTEFLIAEEQRRKDALMQAQMELAVAQEEDRLNQLENNKIFTDERLVQLQNAFTKEEEIQIQARINAAQNATDRERVITEAVADGIRKRRQLREQEREFALRGAADMFGGLADIARIGGKRNFEAVKAFSIAESVIRGILQVQQALSTPPGPPATIPLAAGIGIKAAARTAQIAAQRPSFEQGGIVPGTSFSGDKVLANVNSGEMILNREQQARLFGMASGRDGGPNQEVVVHTKVQLNEETIAEAVSRQVANGLVLGEVQ